MVSVFTLSTSQNHPGLQRLRRSADKFGWPLEVIHPRHANGYEHFLFVKHLYIYDVLAHREGQFLFVDGWDTVFTDYFAPGLTLPSKGRLWFGGDKNLYPDVDYGVEFPEPETEFPYLNSGVIWGDCSEYLRLCPIREGHDQELWIREWIHNTDINVDHNAEFVLNLHSTKAEDLSRFLGGVVRYNPTNTFPIVLHGNGKWPLPNWLEI